MINLKYELCLQIRGEIYKRITRQANIEVIRSCLVKTWVPVGEIVEEQVISPSIRQLRLEIRDITNE